MTKHVFRWIVPMLCVLTAAGLGIDAYIHLNLAGDYALVKTDVVSQATLFRIEGAVAIAAALVVLARPGLLTALIAFVVSAAGVAAVVTYTRFDPGRIGPLPDMYEPVWFTEKTVSLVAEASAAVTAGALFAVASLLQKPEIEGSEHQDDADVRRKSWPEVLPEEQHIDSDDHDDHHHHVQHHGH